MLLLFLEGSISNTTDRQIGVSAHETGIADITYVRAEVWIPVTVILIITLLACVVGILLYKCKFSRTVTPTSVSYACRKRLT